MLARRARRSRSSRNSRRSCLAGNYAIGAQWVDVSFLETPPFTRAIAALLSDEEYRALQGALIDQPERGALIRASGGLRKLRWGAGRHGKSGGIRVIYYWHVQRAVFYMLIAYSKRARPDLAATEVRQLRRLVDGEFS